MDRRAFVLLALCSGGAWAEAIKLKASDSVVVFAEYWPAAVSSTGAKPPLILAFHQAGASHAEYAPLAPRLNAAGFSVLALDQRSGGNEFGGRNQTVAALGKSTPYGAALKDLEAALAWGKAQAGGAPVLVWGSSYSAALVFQLAAAHGADIAGLLAFSPGEYLGSGDAVRKAAKEVRVPVFITQSSDEDEVAQSRQILAATASADKTLFVPPGRGVHGASTLRPDRNARGAEANWTAVMAFLNRVSAAR